MTFLSSDSLVTFKIKDYTNKTDLQQIKEDVLKTYDYIMYQTIKTTYQPPSSITIYLYEENKRSFALKKEIHLYAFKNYSYVLAHELTHVLVGYNFYQESHLGMLTQEGFAEYVQLQMGIKGNLNYDIHPHKHTSYFLKENKLSPLEQLITNEVLMQLVTDPKNGKHSTTTVLDSFKIWMFYVEAASFVSFLIDQYGVLLFEQIYNQPDLINLLPTVYQKSFASLEKEWHTFLEDSKLDYSLKEKIHPTVKSINYYLPKI